jgi:hypothetical protein
MKQPTQEELLQAAKAKLDNLNPIQRKQAVKLIGRAMASKGAPLKATPSKT